ncbi:MAG TPA: ArsA-related P-loop ATPase [Candidatus Binataceae bacterium]|nr:ArsA-related P-loop ATPase [Candidatus Binataceae bacterium]
MTGTRLFTVVKELLKQGSILVLLGTGGVGKTTVAAALGIAAASAHLKTAAITVDPAPRLRDALGLAHLGGEPTPLHPRHLAAAGLDAHLPFSAMMLDAKRTWDAIVERFATDPARRARILGNPFYQALSEEFAGSEAFAALQQLYDLHHSGAFELEVVDTPPAAHAFEFLETPARFARLLDSRTARWLFTPSLSAGRIAVKLASQAARFVVRELGRFAGSHVLSTIADFFAAASESVDALVDRLRKTEALMRSPAVRFILVTTAEEDRLRDARDLLDEMAAGGLRLSAIVINRFLDEGSWEGAARGPGAGLGHLDEIAPIAARFAGETARRRGLAALVRFLGDYRERTLDDIARVASFARELPPGVTLAIAPELEAGVRDLRVLAKMAGILTGGSGSLRHLTAAASHVAAHRQTAKARHA